MGKFRRTMIRFLYAFAVIVLIGVIAFKGWSSKMVKEASQIEDVIIDVSQVEDGVYDGYSEMGPVVVDVRVTMKSGRIEDIEIIRHQNGLGQSANAIIDDMVKKNTYDVDAVSGATVSSEIIMNAVNNALQKGIR